MMNKTTNNRGQSNARARSFDPVKLLRFSLLCMLILLCGGSAWADEVYYTLDGNTSGGNSNYAEDGGGLTQNGMDWSVTGNTTTLPWRIGGKNLTNVDREAYSKTAMGSAITKVELEIGDINLTSVNSIKLIVASGADFSKEIETIEKKDIKANSTLTFNPTSTAWAKGAYYKIVFNITAPNSNKYVQFKSAKFYAVEDTRVATELKFSSELQTSGDIGGSMDLPTVTVSTPSATLDNPTITWESSDPQVASISNGTISFLKYGITTITATFAETDSYLGSSNSFTLRVCGATEDGIFNFSTNNDYGSGYEQGSVKEQSGTWTAGNVTMALSGRNCWFTDGTLRIYKPDANKDNNGKMTFSVPSDKAIKGITISGSKLQHLSANGGTYSLSSDNKTATWIGNESSVVLTLTGTDNAVINTINITYGDPSVNLTAPTFTPAEGTYEEPQAVVLSTTTDEATIYYSTDGENFSVYSGAISVTETTTISAYTKKGEEVSATVTATYTINSPITTITDLNAAAIAGGKDGKPVTYNFTNTKVVFVNGKYNYIADETGYALLYKENLGLTAGKVITGTLTGTAKTYSGLPEIEVTSIEVTSSADDTDVPAPTTISIDELANNVNNYIKVENAEYVSADGKKLSFKVGETNLTVYNQFGLSTTSLTAGKIYDITGFGSINNSTYQIYPTEITEVIIAPAEFQDFEAIVNNQTGTLLTTDEQVKGTAVSFGIAVDTEGKTTRVAADDASAIATISGTYHSEHGLTNMKVVTAVPGAVKILIGKCTYATTKITVTNSDGQTVAEYTPQGEEGSGDLVCWKNDHSNVMELTYTGEATTLTITGMKYCPYIAIKKVTETGPVTLDNEPATATFPFNLGTEGQKATFTKAEYWLGSKVTLGSNFTVNGTGTVSEITETKLKVTAKETAAAESNLIKFTITPKPGLTFTPTKVTFTATRYGTDGGALDIAWLNSGKTTTTLANLKKADGNLPGRDNKTPNFTTFSYDLTTVNGIIAGDGECGLLLNLYDLDAGKNYGFANIIIEGTLSGTEKDVPVLATFTVNGKEYQVEDVFGDGYEATLKLSKTEAMVSSTNAVTATATNGEIGTITYENATETGCKVTIPVTAGETTMNYVLNVTQKPDYTLTYYAVDGTTVLDTDTREEDQTIGEFKVNIADVDASKDGYKARGWFKQNNVGAKYKTTDVVTSNLNLYAVETEIEVSSDFKKYEYDLTDVNFDANDHEAFNPTGIARWHDKQHGWEFKNGDKIDLLVGPKANIIFTLCQHSAAGSTITWDTENSISAVGESDAAIETIAYEGEAGTLSLTINTSNTVYIHSIKIVNTTTTNYTQDGQWIIVKPGDASSFLDALDAANATDGEENVFIFLPDGTYDLGQKTKTQIGRNNVSIIGNSMEGVIIKNAPTTEGIDATATLLNTSSNLYMQDLTIECDAPWIGNAERGVTLQDKGNQTILKNVYLKGKQDTYYSNNPDGTFYFENGMIQGSVDYVCGYGDVYFNNTSFYTVNKSTGGKGGCIAAPNTLKSFGYIFNSCILDGQENENGLYRLARPWGADTKCFFVNTIMVIQPNAAGWGEWSSPKNAVTQFAEYNSVDGSGTPIDLTGRATTIGDQPNNPWLTEAEAAALTPNAIFNGDWKPQVIATQLNAPSAKLSNGTITWSAVRDATAYAIYDGDELLGITTGTSWTLKNAASAPQRAQGTYTSYQIRSANSRGGFGEAVLISNATGIDATLNNNEETTNEKVIYDLNGRRVLTPTKGVYIINGKKVVIK